MISGSWSGFFQHVNLWKFFLNRGKSFRELKMLYNLVFAKKGTTMDIRKHSHNGSDIAEIISNDTLIQEAGDVNDLIGNLYYQGFEKVILYEKNLPQDFLDLKNGIAGEVLQKFSNYGMKLAIVGNFDKHDKKSTRDFIFESNKTRHINFVNSLDEAVRRLSFYKKNNK